MVSNDLNKVYSINELIELGKENSLSLSGTNLLAHNTDSDITYPYQNILREDYRPILYRYSKRVNLNENTFEHYKFNPKLLSYDLYGGVELWHLILWLNNMKSVTEFNKNSLILFDPSYIKMLSRIYDMEEENLIENKNHPMENL